MPPHLRCTVSIISKKNSISKSFQKNTANQAVSNDGFYRNCFNKELFFSIHGQAFHKQKDHEMYHTIVHRL